MSRNWSPIIQESSCCFIQHASHGHPLRSDQRHLQIQVGSKTSYFERYPGCRKIFRVFWRCSNLQNSRQAFSGRHLLHKGPRGRLYRRLCCNNSSDSRHATAWWHFSILDRLSLIAFHCLIYVCPVNLNPIILFVYFITNMKNAWFH